MTNLEKQLRDYKRQGKPLKYLINYMLSMEQYDEMDVLNMMIWLDYDESEIIETLEYDFAIDMSEYKESRRLNEQDTTIYERIRKLSEAVNL